MPFVSKYRLLLRGLFAVALLSSFAPPLAAYLLRDAEDFSAAFAEAGVRGTFVVFDLDFDEYWFHNRQMANTGFLPASTFKIFNSLVALETGVVDGPRTHFKWSGEKTWNPRWNRDHTLQSAFRHSVVWVYREIARQVGRETMQRYLERARYGNRRMGGEIDTFWLEGELRITPIQQVEFLQRLYFDELPFGSNNQRTVKRLMVLERGKDYVLRGKTGWAVAPDPDIGWFVGILESPTGVYFFALCMEITDDDLAPLRKSLALDLLRRRGWLPEAADGGSRR